MKANTHGMHKEASRMQKLRWKLKKELPQDLLEECSTLSSLEHRKDVFDTITHCRKKASKSTARRAALHFEEVAFGEVLA